VNAAIHGFIHLNLLDAKTLKNQLKEIKSQLPIGSGIPIHLDTSELSKLRELLLA
jgi:hypothetical protein